MSIDIRPLRTPDEFDACVELQRETWGRSFRELVPATILKVNQRIGGVTAGAFDESGALVGFVFGMTGVEDGRIVHWSDMLAVRRDLRDRGLGMRLKEYQRTVCKELGATVIYWTFDPLVARNAHLNFNKFGVRAIEYVQDMYGETDSDLHRGLGTDRFIVAWPVADSEQKPARPGTAEDTAAELRTAPIMNEGGAHSPHAPERFAESPPDVLRVEIPLDIHHIQTSEPQLAPLWRASSRRAFLWAMANGYRVGGFYRDEQIGRGYYLLTRSPG